MVYNNCESHKLGATRIPSECLWCDVGIELAQSNFTLLSYHLDFQKLVDS